MYSPRVCVLVGLGVLASTVVVIAQAPVPDGYPALRAGTFTLAPASLVSIGHDDNIHRETPAVSAGELFTVFGADLGWRSGPVRVDGASFAEAVWFKNQPGEGGFSYAHTADLRMITPRVRPLAHVRFSDTYARPTGYELGGHSRHIEFDWQAGLETSVSPVATLNGDFRHLRLDYAADEMYNGSPLYVTLSQEVTQVDAGLDYRVSPLTSLVVTATRDETIFRRDPNRGGTNTRVLAGLSLKSPAFLSGSARVGVSDFSPRASRPFTGVVGAGTLQYGRSAGFAVMGTFQRSTEFSYDPRLDYFLYSNLGTSVSVPAGARWLLVGAVARQWLDYRQAGTELGDDRVDKRLAAGATLFYRVGRWHQVGVKGDWERKTGGQALRAFGASVFWSFGGTRVRRFDRRLPGELQ
jgi:hypothetical protein